MQTISSEALNQEMLNTLKMIQRDIQNLDTFKHHKNSNLQKILADLAPVSAIITKVERAQQQTQF